MLTFNIEMRPYCWWFHDSYVPLTADGYFYGFKETMEYIASIISEKVSRIMQPRLCQGLLMHIYD